METASVLDVVRQAVPAAVMEELPSVDMPTIAIDREQLRDVLAVLRDHPSLQFVLLADLTAVDRLPAAPRYEIVYHLACLGDAYVVGSGPAAPPRRLRLKVGLPADDPRVPSVVALYPTANWLEREVYDLFGVLFTDHPDLRRILMPEDWEGYPLRKDYPVQIRKTPQSWSPIQLSAEEFAEHIRSQRAQADARSDDPAGGPRDRS
jgi:NADH-quinone oxidoreductase subunit C